MSGKSIKLTIIINNNKRTHYKHKRRASGFTLMELLIVLVIIGLLTALVGPAIYQRIKPARHSATMAQIKNLMTALDGYLIDVGRYPATEQGLKALREVPQSVKKWRGPYLTQNVPLDPWGQPYIYRSPGRSGGYEIESLGADQRPGGSDENRDIQSWDLSN